MRVVVTSDLPCPAPAAWSAVETFALLAEVAWPIVTLAAPRGETLPVRWTAGSRIRVRSFLFGLLPLGTRSIFIAEVDPVRRVARTNESDPLVARWDHRIAVEELPGARCRYTDDVEIEAGWRTPLVWAFAWLFYRHRQRRWQGVARRLAAGSAA